MLMMSIMWCIQVVRIRLKSPKSATHFWFLALFKYSFHYDYGMHTFYYCNYSKHEICLLVNYSLPAYAETPIIDANVLHLHTKIMEEKMLFNSYNENDGSP